MENSRVIQSGGDLAIQRGSEVTIWRGSDERGWKSPQQHLTAFNSPYVAQSLDGGTRVRNLDKGGTLWPLPTQPRFSESSGVALAGRFAVGMQLCRHLSDPAVCKIWDLERGGPVSTFDEGWSFPVAVAEGDNWVVAFTDSIRDEVGVFNSMSNKGREFPGAKVWKVGDRLAVWSQGKLHYVSQPPPRTGDIIRKDEGGGTVIIRDRNYNPWSIEEVECLTCPKWVGESRVVTEGDGKLFAELGDCFASANGKRVQTWVGERRSSHTFRQEISQIAWHDNKLYAVLSDGSLKTVDPKAWSLKWIGLGLGMISLIAVAGLAAYLIKK